MISSFLIFHSYAWTIVGWALLVIGVLGIFVVGVVVFDYKRQLRDLQKMREEADEKRQRQRA